MAEEHNALKYSPELSKGAAQVLGGAYGDVGISRMSESLQVIADLWQQPEWAFPRGEKLWAVNPSQAAVAAEFSTVGIRNPSGSQLIVVVDQVVIFTSPGGSFSGRIAAQSTVDATATPQVRDSRIGVSSGGRLQTVSIAHVDPAILGFVLWTVRLGNDVCTVLPFPVVLSPGFDFFVGPTAVNLAANVSFIGRERQAFPGELSSRG